MGGGGGEIEETQAEKDHAQVAAEQWNDYQTRFVPFENKYIADVTGDPSIKADVVGGRVNADIAAQNSGAIPVGGINKVNAIASGYDTPKMAAAGAKAMVDAGTRTRDTQVQGMLSAVNIGRGQASSAIDSMGAIAGNAADEAQTNASAAYNDQATNESAIGSTVGAGIAAVGEYYKPKDKG